MSVEAYVGNTQFGTRYKLEPKDYEKITRMYLRDSNIIYLNAS